MWLSLGLVVRGGGVGGEGVGMAEGVGVCRESGGEGIQVDGVEVGCSTRGAFCDGLAAGGELG